MKKISPKYVVQNEPSHFGDVSDVKKSMSVGVLQNTTGTESRFASIVHDGVLGPPYGAQADALSVFLC